MVKESNEMVENIHFHIKGNGFNPDKGYNLKYLLLSLKSVQNIIEKTYTFVSDKERFTAVDEDNLRINNFGSWLSNVTNMSIVYWWLKIKVSE